MNFVCFNSNYLKLNKPMFLSSGRTFASLFLVAYFREELLSEFYD